MGGVGDLLVDIQEELRDLHAESPRPTWEEAVARLQRDFSHVARKTGNAIRLDDDEGREWIEGALEGIGDWDDEWEGDGEEEEGEEEETEAASSAEVGTSSWPSMAAGGRVNRGADGRIVSVEARINYQQESVELVSTRRDAAGSDVTLDGAAWDQPLVSIANGRGCDWSLESEGFALVHDEQRPHIDYKHEPEIIGTYYAECERLIRQATGAKLVKAFDHNVRSLHGKESGEKIREGNAVQGPAPLVHGDYTSVSGPARVKALAQPPKLNDALRPLLGSTPLLTDAELGAAFDEPGGRFALINVWRPITVAPVLSAPLACCDANTVYEEDLITFQIHYADRIGENYFAKHHAHHTWVYFPQMSRDEALLLKQWDSAGVIPKRAAAAHQARSTRAFSLHTAFADPATPADAPGRESIEVRCVVVY